MLKIKEAFSNFKVDKIDNIPKIINNVSKLKPKINMITKGLLRKQVIILMSNNNKLKFIENSSNYVTNINKLLQSIKSDVRVNFIYVDNIGVVIVTNKIILLLDLQIINKYIKKVKYVISKGVEMLCLSQSKLYLKIIGILYFKENTHSPINADVVKEILKKNHIFNNIILALRP